jgi:hypothetical protein
MMYMTHEEAKRKAEENAHKAKGGSAFPHESGRINNGMTLRDYFAAKIVQADISRVGYYQGPDHMLRAAKNAYSMADAMLMARSE